MANRVILIGNVGKDAPVVKTFDWGKVATFSLATTERGYTTKDGKQVPSVTDWHNIVVKNGRASVVENYVRSGSKLYIEGKITYRSYETKDGSKKYVTEIIADNLELLDKKDDNAKSPSYQPQYQQQQYNQPQYNQPVAQPQGQPQQGQLYDDGLPF